MESIESVGGVILLVIVYIVATIVAFVVFALVVRWILGIHLIIDALKESNVELKRINC